MAQTPANTPVMVADRAVIKLAATDTQTTSVDAGASPYAIVVTLDDEEIALGGDCMHVSGNTVVIDEDGYYRCSGYVSTGAADRGGDRGITICEVSGTNPSTINDYWLVKTEIVGNNSTTRDTHALHLSNILWLEAGTKLWLQFWQHYRGGSGGTSITIGNDDATEPSSYMIIEKVG